MEKAILKYSPALLKIFDEILINAADNKQRDKKMSLIDVNIIETKLPNKKHGLRISVRNDGKGIPIEMHSTEKMYIPELIFGHLLTGSNFDDSQNRLTGGRHGYGAKLTNIFSKSFEIETYDSKKKKKYKQRWEENMKKSFPPTIEKCEGGQSDYTIITFEPDLDRFFQIDSIKGTQSKKTVIATEIENQEKIWRDTRLMFERRVLDIAANVQAVTVTLNSKPLPISSFLDYVKLFSSKDKEDAAVLVNDNDTDEGITDTIVKEGKEIFYSKVNDRWEVAVMRSAMGGHEHMAFVNSIWTPKGGSHVQLVTSQLVDAFVEILQKRGETAHVGSIRNKLMIFLRCNVENPSFDSQSKDTLTSRPSTFGSSCVLKQSFIKQVVQHSGILEDLLAELRYRENSKLLRAATNQKSSQKQMIDVPKLEDAHFAGTKNGLECSLILTEGDSAKALAVSGLEIVGRQHYGVLPLRGKILNVRVATPGQLSQNQEIINICKSLGLDFSKTYENGLEGQGLRYGKVMIMCDQDNDGSHIKALIINFFHHFWPHLIQKEGFLQQFITPLVKVRHGSKTKNNASANIDSFYSMPEYDSWRRKNTSSNYDVKYYKGLGTNTAEEGKEYFKALNKHRKMFYPGGKEGDVIDMAFSRTRADERRTWLTSTYDPKAFIDPAKPRVTYEEFINKELIQFSYADNHRSIPSVIDGLKPSQRKVLYGCFKRNLTNEIKVVQLAGYISEQTAYHHGETSLHSTIINIAQDFVGSNNIPLLIPSGQFGTRAQGGKDFASPRYIFTKLSPITRVLFPPEDDPLLERLEEDGVLVEPKYYVPVVPTLLLNGSQGIGTGWSTSIPPYNVQDIVKHVYMKMRGLAPISELRPWIRGFQGKIIKDGDNFISRGNAQRTGKTTIEISELPYGKWTDDYKDTLCKMVEQGLIKGFTENHTNQRVKFILTAPIETVDKLEEAGFANLLKLENSLSMNNMHAFDSNYKIKKYSRPEEILDDHFVVRLDAYSKRKELLLQQLAANAEVSRNKSRFVTDILSGKLDILKRSSKGVQENMLIAELESNNYSKKSQIKNIEKTNLLGIKNDETIATSKSKSPADEYSYLLDMPIHSLTEEKAAALDKSADLANQNLKQLQAKSIQDLWAVDLDKLGNESEELLKQMKKPFSN